MKKYHCILIALLLFGLMATPAMGTTYKLDDIVWTASQSDPETVADYIENRWNVSGLQLVRAYENIADGTRNLTLDPGVAWSYAAVKYNGNMVFFRNDPAGLAQLQIIVEGHDISNVRFYASDSAPVPEPSTFLLFGSGLAAWVASRKKWKKPAWFKTG